MPSVFPLRAFLSRLLFVALGPLAACNVDGDGGSATDATSHGTTTGTGSASSASGGTTATPTTGGGTGDELPAECACLATDCGPSICATLSAGCPDNCPTDFAVDEAALTCALEALRDGTPGSIDWTYSPNGGGTQEWGRISILADRAAIRGRTYDMIICGGADATMRGPLPGPETYEACLAKPSAKERFDCVTAPLAAPDVVCKNGYQSCGD